MHTRKEFGERFAAIRASQQGHELSQERLANCIADCLALAGSEITVSRQYITSWECGNKPPPDPIDDWLILLYWLKCFVEYEKITSLTEANHLLTEFNYRSLNQAECVELFGESGCVPEQPAISRDRTPWIPAVPAHLVGRDAEIAAWYSQLLGHSLINIITGQGGAGKTALALASANRVVNDNHFRTFVWDSDKRSALNVETNQIEDLKIEPLSQQHFLANIVNQLGIKGQMSRDLARWESDLQDYLWEIPILLVLDNLETIPDVGLVLVMMKSLLQPHRRGCKSRVLATSRMSLSTTTDDQAIIFQHPLRGLSDEASWQLLREEAENLGKPEMMVVDPETIERVIAAAGGLPFVLKLAAGRYAHGISLVQTANHLESADQSEQLHRYLFVDLWLKLSSEARHIAIRVAKLPAGTIISESYIAERVGQRFNSDQVAKALHQLDSMSFLMPVQSVTAKHYSMHSLTREFILSDLPKYA